MNHSRLPLFQQPVHELSAQLERGDLTSVELIESCLGRVENHDPNLGAFIALYGDEALKAGKSADLVRSSGHSSFICISIFIRTSSKRRQFYKGERVNNRGRYVLPYPPFFNRKKAIYYI